MKKLVLLCFLSIVAMLNSATFAQDCCFWVEKEGSTIPEEVYSLNTPIYHATDNYYFHFNNTCGLDSMNTRVSLGWEIYKDGQLLDNGTNMTKLSTYADVTFQVNLLEYGWVGVPVRSGLGNQYELANLNNPTFADYPGAIPMLGSNGNSYLISPNTQGIGASLPNAQNYNFFYLHFLQYASRTNSLRMQVYWKQYGNYTMKFTLYSRSCGTDIQFPYNPNNQHTYIGGHQSTVTGVIAKFDLKPMARGSQDATICSGDVYPFGVQPNGTPYTYFANTAVWPNAVTNTYIVPSYTQPQPCYGPAVARMDTLRLTVNPIPPVPMVANREICGEGEVTFVVTNPIILNQPDVTYRWYSDAALTNMIAEGNTATVSVLNPSNVTTTYNYYVVAIANGCESAPKMVTATSNPIPELSLNEYNETTCPYIHTEAVGVTVLPGSSTGTLTYAWTGATGTTANALINISATCEANYPYSVLVTDSKGCSNTIGASILATDVVAPVVTPLSIITPTTIGCNLNNVPAALDVNGLIEAGFVFSDNCTNPDYGTNFTVAVAREETVLGCTNTLKRYYILYDNCGNASSEFYMEFNVIDNVAPTFTPNLNMYTAVPGPDCSNIISEEMLENMLEVFSPLDNCSQVTTTFSVEPNQAITTTTIVDVTFTDACGNSSTAYVTVTMPDVLTSTYTVTPASTAACYGTPFSFNVTPSFGVAPYTIAWSNPALEGFEVSVTPVLTDEFTDETFTYTYTVTDANGCSTSNTITVLVHAKPAFNLTADLAICLGQSATLTADYISSPITSYVWSNNATTPSITVNPTVTTTYNVTATSEYGCTNSKAVTVTVNPIPEFSVAKTSDDVNCVGDNGAISILPNDGTYNYFIGTTPIVLPFENLAAGSYTITAQNPTTLCTQTATPVSIVDAHVNPTATLAISEITNHCLYEPIPVTLTATSNQANATFVIKVNNVVVENMEGVANYTFTSAGTYTFEVVTTNTVTGCVSNPVSQIVTIYPLPVDPALTANDTEICLGETVTLTATPMMSAYTYQFGTNTPAPINYIMVTPELVGNNTYNVIITTDHGCTATATTTVIVNPLPVIESITVDNTCPLVTTNVLNTVVSGTAPYTLNWDGNVTVSGTNVTLNNLTCGSSNIVYLSVVDSKGCSTNSSTSFTLVDQVNPTIAFANQNAEVTVPCNEIPLASTTQFTVSDNCTPATSITITLQPEVIISGNCNNTYDIQRTWIAQDLCGNTAYISQVIHVVDNIAPVMTSIPANVSVSCDAVPTANVNDPYLMATDNCSASITYSYTDVLIQGSVANTYLIQRNWVAQDVCGNISLPMTQTITVSDEVAPLLLTTTLPVDLTLTCSDVIPAAAVLEYTDNCVGIPTINFSEVSTRGTDPNNANYYNYTITRTWIATDAAGNSTTPIVQVITVQDIEGPVVNPLTVPENLLLTCSDVVPAAANIEISDNCDQDLNISFTEVSTRGTDPNNANYYNYTITRTWNASDASGHVIPTITQVITVEDVEYPVINPSTVPTNLTLTCSDVVPAPANIQITDNCDADLNISFTEVSTRGTDPNNANYYNYSITRTWNASDASGHAIPTITQVITVSDVVAPSVVANTVPVNVTINCPETVPAPANVQFTDNCDQELTITYNQVSTQGTNPTLPSYYNYTVTRTWFATDATGLYSPTITQVITVQDITAPAVVANTVPANVTLNCQDVIPAPATVQFTETCDQNFVVTYNQVSTQGSTPNTAAYYNYTITRTWVAKDASNNSSPVYTQVITVHDITAPVVVENTLPTNVTLTCYDAIPSVANVMFTDNCSTPSITYNQTSTFVNNPANPLFYNYQITRSWYAVDASGNTSTTYTQIITVVDTEAPAVVPASVPANVTVNCGNIPSVPSVLFTDACDQAPAVTYNSVSTQGSNPNNSDYYNYTITRTWFATDVTGHVSPTVTQVITVQDIETPVVVPATIPSDITLNCQDVIPAAPTVSFTDNCDADVSIFYNVVSTKGTNPANASFYNYTLTRTWFASDASNNVSATVTQIVTVHDVTNPTFVSVPANLTIYTTADCSYNASTTVTGTATATDNCYFPTVTFQDELIAGANAGQWTINRTWRAQDVTGNFVTALQVITVTDNTAPTFTSVPANGSVCRNIDGTYENLVTTAIMGVAVGHDNCTTNPTVVYNDNISNVGNENTDGYIVRTWTVTDAVGNTTTATQTINVLHRPTVTITGPNTICQNTTITLTANGATSYVWNTTAETPAIDVTAEGTYSVIGTIANGCSNTAQITVTQFAVPTLTSTVNDQICIGDVVNLSAQAMINSTLVPGAWNVEMISGSTTTTTNYPTTSGLLTHTSAPVSANTYFNLEFTDLNGCSYDHTTTTTIVTNAPRLRLYTDQAAAPNNILNVTTGQDAKFYIKAEACADLNRRAQIQFQVYKDGVALTDLGQYLTDQYLSVSYFTAQNGITTPNPNNTYYNPIANGTYPYANTAQYAPWNGFFVSWTTNAYNWFYMHFFNQRFITVDINAFSQPGQYTIVYNLVGAANECNITDNSTNYIPGYSYGGSGFQFCTNTSILASNTMTINVAGNAIPSQPTPTPVENSTSMKVQIYPNPSNGNNVRMSFDNIEGTTTIKVVTLNGKVIFEEQANINASKNTYQLPEMNLAPGVYFIQVINNDAVLTKKMIIQK